MFKFLKRKETSDEQVQPKKPAFFGRLKESLQKTRHQLVEGLANLVLGRKTVDADLIEEIENLLLSADVGASVTEEIIDALNHQLKRNQLADGKAVWAVLQQHLMSLLQACEQPLQINSEHKPTVILVVGVNGVGKTTTIGKLAHYFKKQGEQVMLAAGDTFRAAATEQLAVWAERNQLPLIAQHQGADSASVIYDALQAANARNIDVLIADTAGRLHTKDNLMQELHKVKKVLAKLDATAPHETLLVLDASIGQNSLVQAEVFHKAIQLTGVVLTKLDGSAKGGMIFSIAKKLSLPIRFTGLGEGIEDLQPFSSKVFIDALFDINKVTS
ncbi:signal recognition particle receptor FtsY [Candidatus Rickettsiella viridis]|uniref:Signal recognition particle receptor FtsY n=1 Tax=Candidatus Rickettsiella viridis TaxID=676208 RepID=A0A2Z5UVA8_9COXI|nr:signal recognition particle-docking protein FtsY [Candidatus Rickettsiella viridis]BBB15404.1 signal recognition particle receptor FtsY [Candidatus Rickettsiella viridis]